MNRMVGAIMVLVLGIPADADAGQDMQPATPEQQFKALLKEYNDVYQDYAKAYREAKTPADQQKVVNEKYPWPGKYAGRFLELAEKNAKTPVAEDALIWILTNEHELSRFRPWYEHAARYEMIRIMTGGGQDKKTASLVRAVLDKNPSKEVRAEAAVALARQMQARLATIKQLKNDPNSAKSVEEIYGKEYFEELHKADPAKLEGEAERLYIELTEKYLPDMTPAAVALLCQQLVYTNDSELLLRVLYTKGKRDDVRGVACLVLAQILAGSPDEKKRKESEKLFEEAAAKYAEVKTAFDGPVGRKARNELFDLRHLSVGKAAPEVEGLDQDGKRFKLSDYKGKVVLLDFWSEF